MNGATAADLAAVLVGVTTGTDPVQVLTGAPDRFTPPAVVVDAAEPWISNAAEEGLPWGAVAVNYTVRVIARAAKNATAEDQLTGLVGQVLQRLIASQVWTASTVTAPFLLQLRENVAYLSADMSVSAIASITPA